jgi:hypothetical protein
LLVLVWLNGEDLRLEVLDPDSGLLLASASDSESKPIPTHFFRMDRMAYRAAQDSAGLPALEIFRYFLTVR